MRIVFGQRNFKIKQFTPQELGLKSDSYIDFKIEVRQNYFHLYWIPFFGTGKFWAIRRDGELYELPNHYQHHIEESQIKVRSPWYTYTLPILILLGFLIYSGLKKLEDYKHSHYEEMYLNEIENDYNKKFENAAINQFYTLKNMKDFSADEEMYLKVEKIYPDKITFAIIPSLLVNSSALELEDYYLQNKKQLKTITILKSDLKNAYIKDTELQLPLNQKFKGINLLKTSKLYRIASMEEKFRVFLNGSIKSSDDERIQIQLKSTGTAFTIVSIKNLENNIPWDIKLPLKIDGGTEVSPSKFILTSLKKANFSFQNNDYYKAAIKVRNSLNMEEIFYLTGNKESCSIDRQL